MLTKEQVESARKALLYKTRDGTPIDMWVNTSYGNKEYGKVGEIETRFTNVCWINQGWAREVPAVAGGWWKLTEQDKPIGWLPLPPTPKKEV